MRRAVAVVAVVAFAAAAGLAQTPPQAPRDQSKSILMPGSAVIIGTVVADDETRAPLRHAFVTLVRSGTEDMRTTSTDEQGAYEFSAMPAGAYRLIASKGGYVAMDYGAPKPGMPGVTVVLSDGLRLAAKPIALIRGAVIGGRLLDATGTPVPNTTVQAAQFLTINGARTARTTSGASGSGATNAHGDFRIYGLLPGEYMVYSRAPAGAPPNQMTADAQRWAENPKGPPPSVSARVMGYAPTLFPGTSDAAAAVPIALARGEEKLGVDLPLQVVPIARMSGVVTGLDGQPAAGVAIVCVPQQTNTFIPNRIDSFQTGPDGKFAFNNLGPGAYTVVARSNDERDAERRAVLVERGLARPLESGAAGQPPGWGMVDVAVNGQDLANLSIVLQPVMSVTGRVVVQGSSARSWPLTTVRVQLAATTTRLVVAGTPTSSLVKEDGTFRIDGVLPGSYRVQVTMPPQPGSTWAAASVTHAGADLLDVPIEVSQGQNLSDVVVTMKDVHAQLTGALVDASGQPAPQLYVFVFSADRAHWLTGARRIRSVRASDAGRYEIAGMPAGEYYLCALTELDTMLQFQPEYLEQLVAASIKITLADGEKKMQDLRIGR